MPFNPASTCATDGGSVGRYVLISPAPLFTSLLVSPIRKTLLSTPHLTDTTSQQVSFKQVIRLWSRRTTQSCCISHQPLPIKSWAFSRPTSQCLLSASNKSTYQFHRVLPQGLRQYDETCRERYDKTSRRVSAVKKYTYTRAIRSEPERHTKVRDTQFDQDICWHAMKLQ